MDLNEDVQIFQNILYQGYNRTKLSGISWLNEFCGKLLNFCRKVQKFIVFNCLGEDEIEIVFLAITQILSCIRYLEKVLVLEDDKNVQLTSSRQHFIDRILWCLARIKSVVSSANDDIKTNLEETNCVDLMDSVLDFIAPYAQCKDVQNTESGASIKDVQLACQHIRSTIDTMLSQILGFANVALSQDKKAITALCQKVLKEFIAFQEQLSINEATNKANWNFQAVLLESALLQLEEYINESLLRMAFKIFVDYSQFSISDLRAIIISNPADPSLDDKIADFDINLDRVIQIGIFAIAFASNVQNRTIIRSCLASLESLDSCLIPSIYTQCVLHSNILEEHYHEEMKKFQNAVQGIIDTVGFCTCYIENLSEGIKNLEKDFNKEQLCELLEMAKVLKEHFQINFKELKIDGNDLRKQQYNNVLTMINECHAILTCVDQIDHSRIIKRFKILRSVVVKLKATFDKDSKNKEKSQTKESGVFLNSNDFDKTNKMFESFGITPTKLTVFYKSGRKRNITDSLKGNYSKLTNDSLRSSNKVKRKVSLRTAMFKRQKSIETTNLFKTFNDNSTTLQITDILDQITSFSTNKKTTSDTSN